MRKLIVASNNPNKISEIKDILKTIPVQIISLKEAGIDTEVEENGKTFLENAHKKAKEISEMVTGAMILADDSGLTVDSLGGAPGVYSARFAGEHGDTKKNNAKLLKLLDGKNEAQRHASFICAMVLITEDGREVEVEGKADGLIINEERGTNGFGYDPLFYIEEYDMTFAQMENTLKNKISHRAKALEKLQQEMKRLIREV
ncbi:MAG: XTP/dITP diphosphatase [Clostridiaceae bacterium]